MAKGDPKRKVLAMWGVPGCRLSALEKVDKAISIDLMHMTSQSRKCSFVWRQARIIARYTNKYKQLICQSIGYARKSTACACEVYVVRTVCFIVSPPKWHLVTSTHKVYSKLVGSFHVFIDTSRIAAVGSFQCHAKCIMKKRIPGSTWGLFLQWLHTN